MLVLGKIVAALFLPPGIFILLITLGVLLGAKGRRHAMNLVFVLDALLIYGLATGLGASALMRPLEDSYPPLPGKGVASAIVVLGGGFAEGSPERGGGGALSADSEIRAVYGIELSRRFGLPLLFSGGRAYDSPLQGSEAEAAGRLWLALGVSPERIRLESESKDTRGNARGVAKLAGTGPFILVTTAIHMPRAVLAFRKAGIAVLAAPTDYRAKRSAVSFSDFLPNAGRLADSCFALHEYLGLVWYYLT